MKYSHWELLLLIYQTQVRGNKVFKFQTNKNLLKTCLKNQWIEEYEEGLIRVTRKGIEEAKEIAPLHGYEYANMGQTY